MTSLRLAFLGFAVAISISLLAGCSNSSEIKVTLPATERPDYSADIRMPGPIRMPSPTAFNVVPYTSNETGNCKSTCTADAAGNGSAGVDAADGGSGSADFQIGYAFDHTG